VARFLIVGAEERSSALAAALQQDGHVARVVGRDHPLGELLGALDHVAIVCWLSAEASPERFMLRAIDSSVRGFVCEAGDWEPAVLETAARNSIPVAIVRTDPHDASGWEGEARAAIEALLTGHEDDLGRGGVPRPLS
jgi:xanthine/CO dehydrogenase XdhC/CoxF family maturation factor